MGRPSVVVGMYIQPALKEWLSYDQILKDVELILRRNNIPVASKPSTPDGTLSVRILAVEDDKAAPNEYAVHLRLSYMEEAVASHQIKICEASEPPTKALGCAKLFLTTVPIWTNDMLLLVGRDNINRLRDELRDLVEDFALDWLKANEKQ